MRGQKAGAGVCAHHPVPVQTRETNDARSATLYDSRGNVLRRMLALACMHVNIVVGLICVMGGV